MSDKVEEYLEAGKRLEDAATPGPWRAHEDWVQGETNFWVVDSPGHGTIVWYEHSGHRNQQGDAEFIAAARERMTRYRRAIEAALAVYGYPRANPDGSPYYEGKVDGYAEAVKDVRDVIERALLGEEKADAR